MPQFQWLRRHSFEVQFWGYETGNVIASITGAGGLTLFLAELSTARSSGDGSLGAALRWLLLEAPEVFATLGVITLVILAAPVSRAAGRLFGPRAADAVGVLAVPLALGLLAYALASDASLFTVAACAFVVGSSLLRGAASLPLLLKLGGLALTCGGVALAGAGLIALMGKMFGDSGAGLALSGVTFLSGICVAGAGLLTYQGGLFAMAEAPRTPPDTLIARLLGTEGRLARWTARRLDRPVLGTIRHVVLPGLFWIPARIKAHQPFLTSMLARLPWRVIAASLALSTGTAAGLAFALANLLWAIGDIAIGTLDFQPENVPAERVSEI